jgi:putative oxidoreductase
MDTALLLLRVAVGLLLIGHGTQKLFGWFGGYGIAGTGGFFESIGFRPGKRMAAVAGISEAAGGLLLALGLFTPLAGAIVVGTLLVAASVHLDKGLWGTNGGYELALVYAVIAAVLALAGPGAASLDNAFGIVDEWSTGLGLAAIGAGLLGAAVVVGRAHHLLRLDAVKAGAVAGEARLGSAA